MLIKIYSKMTQCGNAIVPMTGSRNGARGEVFDGGHKIKSVKIVSTSKGNSRN
jgi:hypothetical protein